MPHLYVLLLKSLNIVVMMAFIYYQFPTVTISCLSKFSKCSHRLCVSIISLNGGMYL